MVIEWEDPPVVPRLPSKFSAFWEELRANPKRWARYPGSQSPALSVMRKLHHDMEFNARTVGGERRVYVRYVGGEEVA